MNDYWLKMLRAFWKASFDWGCLFLSGCKTNATFLNPDLFSLSLINLRVLIALSTLISRNWYTINASLYTQLLNSSSSKLGINSFHISFRSSFSQERLFRCEEISKLELWNSFRNSSVFKVLKHLNSCIFEHWLLAELSLSLKLWLMLKDQGHAFMLFYLSAYST